jgi:hypothetical protein
MLHPSLNHLHHALRFPNGLIKMRAMRSERRDVLCPNRKSCLPLIFILRCGCAATVLD